MFARLITTCFFILVALAAKAQQCEWLEVAGSSTGIENSFCITTDKNNDVIIAGEYTDSFYIGPYLLPQVAANNGTSFIAKYNEHGVVQWVRPFTLTSNVLTCYASSVATDANNNIYVTGMINLTGGTVNFGNGISLSGSSLTFLVKFNPAGVAQWAVGCGISPGGNITHRVAVDKANNVYFGFTFVATGTFPGTSKTITAGTYTDFGIAKYTAGGTFINAASFGASGSNDFMRDMGMDGDNNIYLLGYSVSTFSFGTQSLADTGEVILKIDTAFNPIRGKKTNLNIRSNTSTYGIAVCDNGRLAVTANLYDSVNYGNGIWLKSPFSYTSAREITSIVFYDSTLTPLWARKSDTVGGPSDVIPLGGASTKNGYIYVGGYLNGGSARFGSSVMTFVGGQIKIFITKADTLGNVLWAFASNDTNGVALLRGSASDYNGDAYVTGFFQNKVTLFNKSKQGFGSSDIYTAKISDYAITRGYVSSGPYCAGDTIKIPYTKKGVYQTGNEFIAHLSDSAGSFEGGERELGRLTDTASGIINGFLPLFNIATTNKYRIRIISTKPIVQGYYKLDTLRLLVYSKDTANAGPDTLICSGQSIRLGTTGGSRWRWWPPAFMLNPADTANRQPLVKPDSVMEYRIIISDSSGCGQIDTDYVKVLLRPFIDVQVAGDSMVCRGNKQTLRAMVTGGNPAKYWYVWRTVGPNALVSNKDTAYVAPFTTTTYRLVVGDSCSNKNDTVFFTIHVSTTLNVLHTPDTTICKGKDATLAASGNGCNPQFYSYRWYKLGDANSIGSGSSIVVNPAATTLYRVILRDTTTLLADTSTVKVTVDTVFNVVVTKDTTICRGQSLSLHADVFSCDTSQMEYDWDNGLGKGEVKTVSPGTNTVYTVIGTNKFNGLADTAKVTVTVRNPLKITLNADTTICAGQTARLRAITNGGNANTHKIQWAADSGPWTDTNKILTVLPVKTTTYTATLSDGCTTTPHSAKITVTVRPPLKVTVNPDTAICIGQNAQLRATISGGNISTHSLLWTVDNGSWMSNNLVNNISPTTTSTYKAALTDGCTVNPDSAKITVTVRPPLKITVNADTTICTGQTVKLRATVSGGYAPNHAILWTVNGGPWTDTNKTVTVSPTATSIYTATLKDNCTNNADSAKITLTVRPPLQINITANDSICANQVLLLTGTISGGYAPNYQIRWTADSLPWTSLSNPTTDTPKQNTVYKATVSDNCSPDADTVKKVVVLAVPRADFDIQPKDGCPPLEVIFTDKSTGNDTLQNTWRVELSESKGVTAYARTFTKPGNYNAGLLVSNALGCTDYVLKNNSVVVFDKPIAAFTIKPDIKEIESPLLLYNYSQRATNYTWDFGDGGVLYQNNRNDTVYSYKDTGYFDISLIAENEKKCKDTLILNIKVFDKINCTIPSAFTPGNSDNLNPVFAPVCAGAASYTLSIYNRWGQGVHQCENCAWDGTYNGVPVPAGIYMYKLQIQADSYKKSLLFGVVNVVR